MGEQFTVTIPGKSVQVKAVNPLTAAFKAFPECFERKFIYDAHTYLVQDNVYIVSLRSEVMRCVITVERTLL